MYESHPTFKQPTDGNVKVWRYLDFTKFISMIDTCRLYFTRSDKFNDPFEGSWPKINIDARKTAPFELDEKAQQIYLENMAKLGVWDKRWPRFIAVNCWHENNYESAAMWKLYLKSDEGIAIQSTFNLLKKSITDDEKVYIGKIKYIDYEKEFINAGNLLEPFVHKRKSFEHEKEIRAVTIKYPKVESSLDFSKDTILDGIPLKVDIETLIQKIYVAPNAPKWFSELVLAVVKRYGYDFEVIQSQLNNAPFV